MRGGACVEVDLLQKCEDFPGRRVHDHMWGV